MKKILLTAASMMVALGVYAQGTVQFDNITFGAGAIDAPVFDVDETTRLAGSGYMAQLYAGPDAASLAPIGSAVAFQTGAGAGYFIGGPRTIGSVAPGGTATISVRAWDVSTGATWEAAGIRGESDLFTVVTGGSGEPPSLPTVLSGLESFSLVPEPSTIALGVIGAAALLLRRRK